MTAPDDPPPEDDDALVGEVLDAAAVDHALVPARDVDHALALRGPADPLARLLHEIRRYPLLSDDDERDLGRRARDHRDADAMRKLGVHNLRLVVHIAFEFRRRWSSVLDLVQEGSTGLVEAAQRWDPDRGARFGTYAGYWIRAFVLRFLLTNFRLVHTGNTRAGRRLFFQLERERQRLLTQGFEPTSQRLAERLGTGEEDVREVAGILDGGEVSFDAPAEAGGAAPAASGAPGPEAEIGDREALAAVGHLADAFRATLTDPREQALWDEHLRADEPAPLAEIAARFGQTKQRMGQLTNGLRARFRERLEAQFGASVRDLLDDR